MIRREGGGDVAPGSRRIGKSLSTRGRGCSSRFCVLDSISVQRYGVTFCQENISGFTLCIQIKLLITHERSSYDILTIGYLFKQTDFITIAGKVTSFNSDYFSWQ